MNLRKQQAPFQKDTRELLEEIYRDLDVAEAVSDLAPQENQGYYVITCPECGEREAYIYKPSPEHPKPYLNCNRKNQCGYAESLWDYLQNSRGLTPQQTLQELARLAHYSLPDAQGVSEEQAAELRKRADILETALEFFQAQLWTTQGKDALERLQARGYAESEIQAMGVGAYPGNEETRSYLVGQGYSQQTIESVFKWLEYRDEYKIVIPYRDPGGRLRALWGRLTRPLQEGEKEGDKYKPHTGAGGVKATPFLLDRARGRTQMVVVEGYFDALIASAKGLEGTVALGQASLSEPQLDAMIRYGAKQIILALDHDPAGEEGTERALTLIARKGLRGFVALLPEGQDPDDLIRERGIDALERAVENAQSGTRWKAERLLSRHDLGTDRGWEDAVEEALAFEETLRHPRDARHFRDALTQGLGVPLELLEPEFTSYHEKKARECLERGYRDLLRDGEKLLQEGKLDELTEALQEGATQLRLEYQKAKATPTLSLSEYLREKHERESQREGGLLGYRLNTFSQIAKHTDGIQAGLYMIGGETNVGKTAFLSNLFLDLLLANPEVAGLYFSLDDNKDVIVNRFLSLLTRLPLNEVRRKAGPIEAKKIETAYQTLIGLAENGRLDIRDLSEVHDMDALELEIRERAESDLVVAIDGLYNLEVGKGYGGLREENVERANKVKALVDAYQIPIMATGELRKDATDRKPTLRDLMETGKFGYNANLVWLLYVEDAEAFKETDAPVLTVDFAKNKLSAYRGSQKLTFVRAQGRLEPVKEKD